MSYSNTLNANANMYSKAKIMLEGDIQKKRYNRGLSKSMANKETSDQLISDKIQQIIGEKRDIAKELTRDFNRNLFVHPGCVCPHEKDHSKASYVRIFIY